MERQNNRRISKKRKVETSKTKSNVERKKRLRNRNANNFVFWILGLFVVYVFFFSINSLSKEGLAETKVSAGSVSRPSVYSGVITRDEKVYNSQSSGTVIFEVEDKTKIKANTSVCVIQDTSVVKALEGQLQKKSEKILSVQEERVAYSGFQGDVVAVNESVKRIVEDNIYKLGDQNFKDLYDFKNKLDNTIEMRNKLVLNEEQGSVAQLVRDKQNIEGEVEGQKERLRNQESGVVSFELDGFEETFTFANKDLLTEEQTLGAKAKVDGVLTNREVSEGVPVFKIVQNNRWYIGSFIPTSETLELKEGNLKTIYIRMGDDYKPLEVTVDKLEDRGKKSLVIFSVTKFMTEYLNLRNIEFKIDLGVSEGLKIPNSSIADRTIISVPQKYVTEKTTNSTKNLRTVLKVGDKVDKEISLDIISSDKNNYYVLQNPNTLNIGDKIKLNKDSETFELTEFDNVKGVYSTNSGIPVFKIIDSEGILSADSQWTILDKVKNKNLKLQDSIITDAKTVVSTN